MMCEFFGKRMACVIVAGAAFVGLAYAGPIRFDNPAGPGHYVWALPGVTGYLYVTYSAEDQFPNPTPVPDIFSLATDSGLTIGSAGGVMGGQIQVEPPMLVGVGAGEAIPSGFTWANGGTILSPEHPSMLPDAAETYLGVRFTLGDGLHYGWIGVVRNAAMLDAFAWGYETEPGVPILAGAPEPGTLAMLACGAAALLRPRRRRSWLGSQVD